MARGHPISLPSKMFSTKTEAKNFFKEMLDKYKDGEKTNNIDSKLLFELLSRHPESEEKIGVGVKNFYRDKSQSYPTSCFHLERHDGTTTDFSIPTCISSQEPTKEQSFYHACRTAVSKKLISQKNDIFKHSNIVKCYKTGEAVEVHTSEYRHTSPSFKKIVNDFITVNNIKIDIKMVVESDDMQYATKFSDLGMALNFDKFHSRYASLEIFKKFER